LRRQTGQRDGRLEQLLLVVHVSSPCLSRKRWEKNKVYKLEVEKMFRTIQKVAVAGRSVALGRYRSKASLSTLTKGDYTIGKQCLQHDHYVIFTCNSFGSVMAALLWLAKIRRRGSDANSTLCALVPAIFLNLRILSSFFLHMQLTMNMMLSSLGQEGQGYVQQWCVSSMF